MDLLYRAWERVHRKGASGGIDGVSVDDFEARIERNLQILCDELNSQRYIPEASRRIAIPKEDGQKRMLSLPTVRDKVAQMAVLMLLEEKWEREFLDCSYAYRKGKGVNRAIGRVEHYLNQKLHWVATCDIDDFFDSIDHTLLLDYLLRRGTDPRFLRLIELWIKMGFVHRGRFSDVRGGVPQGAVISPLLANIYLHPFDQHLRDGGWSHVRYADDFVILCRSKDEAEMALLDAEKFLTESLHLRLNPLENPVRSLDEGFIFLGINFQGSVRSMAPGKLAKAKRKLQEICSRASEEDLTQVTRDVNALVQLWRHHYHRCNDRRAFEELDGTLVDKLEEALRLRSKPLTDEERRSLDTLEYLLPIAPRERTGRVRKFLVASKETPKPRKGASAPPSVAQAVAARRRKYQRRFALTSELVVSSPRSSIGLYKGQVQLRHKGRPTRRVSLSNLRHIVVLADPVSISSNLIRLCAQRKVQIEFLDFSGRPQARLDAPHWSRWDLSLSQIEAARNGKGAELAKAFVRAKMTNQRNLLKYLDKYRKRTDPDFHTALEEELPRMENCIRSLEEAEDISNMEELRRKLFALEAKVASSYWKVVRHIVPPELEFPGRRRKGALDLVNQMLNYGYGILYGRVYGAVTLAGLNPNMSFLHAPRADRPTLVYDLVEEFRVQVVDRVIFGMLGRGEPAGMEEGRLDGSTRRNVTQNVLERLALPMSFRGGRKPLDDIIRYQAGQVARFLSGEVKRYRPFVAKW